MTTRLSRSLLAASLALATTAPSIAQQRVPERFCSAILLVRCGATDIVLNEPLLEALLGTPDLEQRLKQAFDDDYAGRSRIDVDLPAPHPAGTFQVHVTAHPRIAGDWTPARRSLATRTIVEHLQQKLDRLLFAEPHARLDQRRIELRRRHRDLQLRALELRARLDRRTSERQRGDDRRDRLTGELRDAQVKLATSTVARDYLQAEQQRRAQRLQASTKAVLDAEVERQTLHAELQSLEQRLRQQGDDDRQLHKLLRELQVKLATADARIADRRDEVAQVRQQLTLMLEELPAAELEQQRAETRVAMLVREQTDRKDDRQDETQSSVAALRIEVEQVEIDVQIARQQLIETEGDLGRLQPVRYEVFETR